MNHNTPQDKSGSHDESGTYINGIDAFVADIKDRITFLLDDNNIDELSAYEREQLVARYYGLLLRALSSRDQVTTAGRIDTHQDELAAIVKHRRVPDLTYKEVTEDDQDD